MVLALAVDPKWLRKEIFPSYPLAGTAALVSVNVAAKRHTLNRTVSFTFSRYRGELAVFTQYTSACIQQCSTKTVVTARVDSEYCQDQGTFYKSRATKQTARSTPTGYQCETTKNSHVADTIHNRSSANGLHAPPEHETRHMNDDVVSPVSQAHAVTCLLLSLFSSGHKRT